MIETCLCTLTIQNTNGCELVLEAAHCHIILISEHCKFMLVKFVSVLIIPLRPMQYPVWRVELVFPCTRRLSKEGTAMLKLVAV